MGTRPCNRSLNYRPEVRLDPNRKPAKTCGQQVLQFSDAQREAVSFQVAMGVPHEKIADLLDVHPDILYRHFARELATGKEKADELVARNLFKLATTEDFKATPAAIWWTKSRMRWKEDRDLHVTNKVTVTINSMSDAELDRYIEEMSDDDAPIELTEEDVEYAVEGEDE